MNNTATQFQPQLPPKPDLQSCSQGTSGDWFEYLVQAYPHHTDYAGVVWHGTYLTWMEEARVEYLHQLGIDFATLVGMGCDLPVVELSVRYHRPVRMGQTALVKARMADLEGVRILWDYQIQSPNASELYVSAQVTLVAVDREKGKILRQLPATIQSALAKR
ncbi:hypothetical protein DO97_17265 [Neosynechococcus sphagnicola sy1]|uniref:Thioesterase domain-containing protein n=1 Tax=Neosynechococcus sphagnicola sy1 TaxID=1497020 RepID=A0A098THW0_9CYAN|nr:thioesterase family protein [Neosynechococcus sphagnicola]KGF71596.1 hypothetical protein DO97_17265 [Neosynechococcus sphagnicola sy1]